jgi:pSer/pThr/pTyr-binding forkhead associated (FHA) protein
MEIVVEVFEQGQRRSFLRRYQAESISVGRGWDNDVIIRDPLIDASHLSINTGEDGQWWIEDKGSINGTRLGRFTISEPVPVEYGKVIAIGHSQIRLHRVDQEVAPALKLGRMDEAISYIAHPAVAALLAVAAVFLGVYADILGDPSQTNWSAEASQGLTIGAGLLGWAIVWGSIARLLRHEATVWPHLSLISLLLIGSICAYWLVVWISFNTLSLFLNDLVTGLSVALLLFGMLIVGLNITIRMSQKHMTAIAAGITFIAISLLYLLPALEEDQRQNAPEMVMTAKPPSFLFAGSQSGREFLEGLDGLFERLELDLEDEDI